MNNATIGGHLDVVQWLLLNRIPGRTDGIADAINKTMSDSDPDTTQWLSIAEQYFSNTERPAAEEVPAQGGHLDVADDFWRRVISPSIEI